MQSQNDLDIRTYDPKHTHYISDRSGRDTFVNYNNRGLSASKMNYFQGSSDFALLQIPKSPYPVKVIVTFQDRLDGTGNDTYIYVNSGGLKIQVLLPMTREFIKIY